MKSPDARAAARKILTIVPRVMRSLASELRAVGELPAPAHFGVLSMLAAQRRGVTLTRLAALHGVSLPTMSNTVTAMEDRGWVRRTPRQQDRRIVQVEVTASGRAVLRRVRRVAEVHLAAFLAPLGPSARQQLEAGLDVLTRVFARATARPSRPARPGPSARPRQTTRPAAL